MILSCAAIGRVTTVATIVALALCLFDSASVASAQTGDAQATYDQAIQLLQTRRSVEALALIAAAINAGGSDPALYNL